MSDPKPNHVTVTVDANGTPVCTPDPLRAKGKNATLKFQLAAPGYVFPDQDAVVVDNPGSAFPDPSQTIHPDVVTLQDRNKEPGSFKYTVTVKQVSTGKLVPLDPTIENGDP